MLKRIYVAGAYSNESVIEVFNNMRRGMRVSTEVMLKGYAPFCPWNDYNFQLQLKEDEQFSVHDYYEYSLAWLEVSDAVLVLPNYEKSVGTLKEIEVAEKLGIPVYYNMEDLLKHTPAEDDTGELVMKEVESSNIAKIGYKDTNLFVEFKSGGVYRYADVSAVVYKALMESESKGKFINSTIKPHNLFERIN